MKTLRRNLNRPIKRIPDPLSIAAATSREHFRNILVVRQHDQLGDMLCAVPLLQTLRSAYPAARISLVTSPVNHEIMLHHPAVDEIIYYDKRTLRTDPARMWTFIRSLRTRHYDLAVVPATVSLSTTSNVMARLSGAAVRIGPGSLEGRRCATSWCFTTPIDLGWRSAPHIHQSKRNLAILSPLGLAGEELTCTIGITGEERASALSTLSAPRKRYRMLVGFHPGAGKVPNRWPAERFADLADRIATRYGAGIVITEGPMDEQPVDEMRRHLHSPFELINARPIREVAALIDQLDLYITNDTGVMHIAGATRPRLLSLFGPTDPLQWAPIGAKNRFITARDGNINSIPTAEVENTVDIMILEIQRDLKLV